MTKVKDFFVMLTTPDGGYTPLLDDTGEIAKFEYVDEATITAFETELGEEYGYEVFEIGRGLSI
jgi:hypothetical protein